MSVIVIYVGVFDGMQIPYPKRKFIFDGESCKDHKTVPHKVSYYSLHITCVIRQSALDCLIHFSC